LAPLHFFHVRANAYKINDNIAVYLKYATTPVKGEYLFTFTTKHLAELSGIAESNQKTLLALVCVKAREICCLPHSTLISLITRRRQAVGHVENQYVLVVTVPAGKSFHVYVNAPGVKGKKLGNDVVVPRTAFPGNLFQ
jgi:hypothetical protein